ncbi:hypothetical protein OIY81_115 [Cryptosporidium canis]|uniref:Uncharacterized protein n=1 Tax=Cryptosporidium canis TaxID=195482 RepID=A0ABQ8PBT7_9CRYT|nr:hypothetical protein OJ252_396 [Cryptosporidium canis]KAJ1615149.1 hypothetical protein OIY81_115 [Cryptosporidium canis]
MKAYISEDEFGLYDNSLPSCRYSPCYISLVLGSLTLFGKKHEFESNSVEFILSLTKKCILTGEELQIGNISLLPFNYCTPFEKNHCSLYLHFISLSKLKCYLENNELSLKLNYGTDKLEIIYEEVLNYIIKPVTSVKNKLVLSNNNKEFSVSFTICVEWSAIVPMNLVGDNFSKDVHTAQNYLSHRKYKNQILYDTSITGFPSIFKVYEKTICEDPIVTRKVVSLESKFEELNDPAAHDDLHSKIDFQQKNSNLMNKLGGWIVNIKDVILLEKGFIHLYDMFPKYSPTKYYKTLVHHCIKDRDGHVFTHVRKHWSIMNFLRGSNSHLDGITQNKHYYTAKANIYSRIPEIITDKIDEKLFFINFLIPSSNQSNGAFQSNSIFFGELKPSEISVTNISTVKLYSEINKEVCLGYVIISISDIKEKPKMANCNNICTRFPTIQNDHLKIRQNTANYLEEISIVYLFLYWHIQTRSINEKRPPESILLDLYSRISNSRSLEGEINVAGINKCINALISSRTEAYSSLKSYICCIPESLALFNSVSELKYYLKFPHLEIFENSYTDIFSNASVVLDDTEFLSKCNELGIRESISTTWKEMLKKSYTEISFKTYKMCVQQYKIENIFSK